MSGLAAVFGISFKLLNIGVKVIFLTFAIAAQVIMEIGNRTQRQKKKGFTREKGPGLVTSPVENRR